MYRILFLYKYDFFIRYNRNALQVNMYGSNVLYCPPDGAQG